MYEEQVTQFYDVKYLNQDIQSIQQDIKSIKKNMKGWTKLFSQIMELSIQNSKQNQQNSYMLQDIMQKIGKNSYLNLSPIKKQTAKTEPDEFIKINSLEYPVDDQALKSENISRILNQGKKMSIMHLQGTPFDSAYESINREMQGCDDSMKTTKIYDELQKFALNNPLTDSQPQSLKNKIYQSNKQLQKADSHRSTSNDKENQFAKKMVSDQRKSRVSLKEPKLSTVIEESVINMSPYISQNFPKGLQISTPKNLTNGLSVNSCSNKQTFLGFDFQQNFVKNFNFINSIRLLRHQPTISHQIILLKTPILIHRDLGLNPYIIIKILSNLRYPSNNSLIQCHSGQKATVSKIVKSNRSSPKNLIINSMKIVKTSQEELKQKKHELLLMVYKFDLVPWVLRTGLSFEKLQDALPNTFAKVTQRKFDIMVLPIFPPNIQRIGDLSDFVNFSHIKSDLQLTSNQFKQVYIRATVLDLNQDENKKFIKKCILQEIEYAAYLGVPKIIIPINQNGDIEILSNRITKFIKKIKQNTYLENTSFVLELDINNPNSWTLYNYVRTKSGINYAISLTIQNQIDKAINYSKWKAENLQIINIQYSAFTLGNNGLELISDLKKVVLQFFPFEPYYLVQGKTPNQEMNDYRMALINLFKTQEAVTDQYYQSFDYNDVLQLPLQPYKDNLSSATYEVFEQDKQKYDLYEQACVNYYEKNKGKEIFVLMAGAGRGGILDRVILAAIKTKAKAYIYAIEKNPYAYMTLVYQQQKNEHWRNIKIINSDLKTWETNLKFDLVVSELLGSFGDNELSPECLGWSQKYMKESTISIPQSSTSYLVPVSCPLLHNQIKQDYGKGGYNKSFVVQFHKSYTYSEIQDVFTYIHPDFQISCPLTQNRTLQFILNEECYITGFAGFFESSLIGNIKLSTHPKSHTYDMYSWFPIYFPIEIPFIGQKDHKVVVQFGRFNDEQKVWYEWSYQLYDKDILIQQSLVHNKDGIEKIFII